MKITKQINDWQLRCVTENAPAVVQQTVVSAHVPGDITDDLMRAGLVEDIQFASNYLKYRWINETEWEYRAEFSVGERDLKADCLSLFFEGIDTFSDIFVNGKKVMSTHNMFVPYKVDIKEHVRLGTNEVKVCIKPVPRYDETRYFGAFASDRLLVRKAQCHYGWDWAPAYMGMGLWGKVFLLSESDRRILSVRVRTRTDGTITFFPELSYSPRKDAKGHGADRLRVCIYDGDACVVNKSFPVCGYKNLCNVTLQAPKLWYPNGYGEQPVYRYTVEIVDEAGYSEDTFRSSFGIRSAVFAEEPSGDGSLGFHAVVNGRKIFLMGSNWVPASFMTGAVDEERYRKLLTLAKDANFNVLRVWGGGIYEKDIFYRLCDEYGILVFHDFPFACGDIPDDNDEFCREVEREALYQVKRLDNHPCMLLWNGGNEVKESFAYSSAPELGKHLNHILAGICAQNTDIPYFSACPWSYTDFGNDLTSGDCHRCALFEATLAHDLLRFRDYIIKEKPLATEIAAIGPCRLRNLKKFLPEHSLSVIDSHWEVHCVNNPYEPKLPKSFAHMEREWAAAFFGRVESIADFVKKAMIVQADVLTAEIDECRARSFCGGALSWMYNDIWRNATWAAVDYDFGCKPAYYAMKRAFSRVRAGFIERDGVCAYLVNNSSKPLKTQVFIGRKSMDGQTIFERHEDIDLGIDEIRFLPLGFDGAERSDSYLYVSSSVGKSILMKDYRGRTFVSDLSFTLANAYERGGRFYAECTLKANAFAKAVYVDGDECIDLYADDNFFDLEAGEERRVILSACKKITQADISIRTIAEEWD